MALINNLNANFKQLSEENKVNNGYLTGGISTEKKMFEQVKEMKRSTFDRSKFTVVGSPTLVGGVIDNINTNNKIYYKASNIDFSNASSWSITQKFNFNSIPTIDSGNQRPFSGLSNNAIVQINSAKHPAVVLSNTKAGDIADVTISNITLDIGQSYLFKLVFTGSSYMLYMDGVNIWEKSSNTKISNTSAIYLFIGNTYAPCAGKQDLSQFSITVDGQEVFNGNKTGIDQIKKDDYTVVGNLVISDDGVASEFSSNNYIDGGNHLITFNQSNKIRIEGEFQINEVSNHCLCHSNEGFANVIYVADSNYLRWQIKTNPTVSISLAANIKLNRKYRYKAEFGEGLMSLEVIDLLSGDTKSSQITTTEAFSHTIPTYIGAGAIGGSNYLKGKFNLNKYKIYIDDELVYQPTLRIPYTQAKTGAKIVDSIYRDSVVDVYEQFGQANYYTLGDNNFTLPMGEIYGMIEKKVDLVTATKSSFPSERYVDLTLGASGSKYTAPANGWFFLSKIANSSLVADFRYVNLVNDTVTVGSLNPGNYQFVLTSLMPARKGDVIRGDYNATGNTLYFRFIYAEGSKGE